MPSKSRQPALSAANTNCAVKTSNAAVTRHADAGTNFRRCEIIVLSGWLVAIVEWVIRLRLPQASTPRTDGSSGSWRLKRRGWASTTGARSEEHTSELQSPCNIVCRLLLEKKK